MVSDTREFGDTIPDITIIDPFERLGDILSRQGGAMERVYAELASVGYEIWGPFQSAAAVTTGAPLSQHIRFRVREILITTDTAGVVTLVVGSALYPFVVAVGNLAPTIRFPLVIERGSDVSFAASVAATMDCYLIGRPE